MKLLAIDPGTAKSAWLIYDCDSKRVVVRQIDENELVLDRIRCWARRIDSDNPDLPNPDLPNQIVIEDMEGFGLPVGKETFRTILWSGRFIEAWQHGDSQIPFYLLTRRLVKLHLCGTSRAKDLNVKQLLVGSSV